MLLACRSENKQISEKKRSMKAIQRLQRSCRFYWPLRKKTFIPQKQNNMGLEKSQIKTGAWHKNDKYLLNEQMNEWKALRESIVQEQVPDCKTSTWPQHKNLAVVQNHDQRKPRIKERDADNVISRQLWAHNWKSFSWALWGQEHALMTNHQRFPRYG